MQLALLLLPLFLCCVHLAHSRRTHKHSASRLYAHNLDRIEPPEGLGWMRMEESANKAKGDRPKKAQKMQMFDDEDRQLHVELRRHVHSMLKNTVGEQDTDPVRDFYEWEREVAAQQHRMRRIQPSDEQLPLRLPSLPTPGANSRNLRSPCLLPSKEPLVERRTYPRSWEFPGFEASVPRQWDWRSVNGVNYCSPNRNQHIPVYCGSCWVFGTLGSINDRFNVARKGRWPMTMLSPQEIISCNGRGSCNGGSAEDVFNHAKIHGLVEEGCNNYKAVNEKCDPYTRCGSCWPDNCFAIQNYTRYYIKDYGKVAGRLQMMSEIHNRGPIACSMSCTSKFDYNYTGGIYQEFGDAPTNHIVSVTGWDWDEESKTEYWIVRNSWGDAWGEQGWFRIVTSLYRGGRGDQYNLGIERDCYFADPDISNLK